jgi:hypothetical protein
MAEIVSMEPYWVQNVLEIFKGFQSLLPDGRLEVTMCPGRSCNRPSRHRSLLVLLCLHRRVQNSKLILLASHKSSATILSSQK